MSKFLNENDAYDVAASANRLYDALQEQGFLSAQAWEFVKDFYRGAGKS